MERSINLAAVGEWVVWVGICALLALFLASGFWLGVAVLVGGPALVLLAAARFRTLLVVWMIGMPTAFVFANNMLKSLPIVTADRLLLVVLVATMAARVLCRSWRLESATTIEKAMLVFVGVLIVSLLATAPQKPLLSLYKGAVMLFQGFVMPFSAFLLARHLAWSERHLSRVLSSLSIVGVYLAVIGCLQYFFHITIFMPRYLELNHELDRATGSFANAVEYGSVLSLLLLVTVFQAGRAKDALVRSAFWMAAFAMVVGVLISKTRGVWLAVIAALVVVSVADRRVRPVLATASVLALVALVIGGPFLLETELFQQRVANLSSIYNRLALYATAVNMIVWHPLVGIGFGYNAFAEERADYMTSIGAVSAQWGAAVGVPHSEFLHLFVLTGLAGIVPYVLIYVFAWSLVRRVASGSSLGGSEIRSGLATYMKAGLVVIVVNALFVDLIFFTYLMTLFYFLLGLVASSPDGGAADRRAAPASLTVGTGSRSPG